MENDNISRKIVSLQHLYEHEIKINEFYHEFADASKGKIVYDGIHYLYPVA